MQLLLSQFDDFAHQEGLENPGGVIARNYVGRRRAFELEVVTYLGEVGSTVALYGEQSAEMTEFKSRLAEFVRLQLQPRWRVRDCREVPELLEMRRYN